MTERLYENDSYTVSFDAEAKSVQNGDGVCFVTLDRTFFFPVEGGQSCDRGTINGYPVTDVQIRGGRLSIPLRGSFPKARRCTARWTGNTDFGICRCIRASMYSRDWCFGISDIPMWDFI